LRPTLTSNIRKGIMNEEESEIRAVFESISTDSKVILPRNLRSTYHQYKNGLALTSSVMSESIDQFRRSLLDDKSGIGVMISETEFVAGIQRLLELIENAETSDGDEFINEIEKMCLKVAGNNPEQFAKLLNLPEALSRQEVITLMKAIQKRPK